jgi:hypothetical protein
MHVPPCLPASTHKLSRGSQLLAIYQYRTTVLMTLMRKMKGREARVLLTVKWLTP